MRRQATRRAGRWDCGEQASGRHEQMQSPRVTKRRATGWSERMGRASGKGRHSGTSSARTVMGKLKECVPLTTMCLLRILVVVFRCI